MWKSLFCDIVNTHAPLKTFRAGKKKNIIFNEEVASLRVTQDEYHAEAIKTGNPNTWSVYRKLQNHVTKLARKSKTSFFKSAIQNSKGDSKTMWGHVNKLFPKTKSSGIPSLEIDGCLITTPKDIANKFNTFFVSIGENLANLIAEPSRTALD